MLSWGRAGGGRARGGEGGAQASPPHPSPAQHTRAKPSPSHQPQPSQSQPSIFVNAYLSQRGFPHAINSLGPVGWSFNVFQGTPISNVAFVRRNSV